MRFKWEYCDRYPGEINLTDADLDENARNNVVGWLMPKYDGEESPQTLKGYALRACSFDSQYEADADGNDENPHIFPTLREAMRTLRREVTLFVISGGKYGVQDEDDE